LGPNNKIHHVESTCPIHILKMLTADARSYCPVFGVRCSSVLLIALMRATCHVCLILLNLIILNNTVAVTVYGVISHKVSHALRPSLSVALPHVSSNHF
jgi:hypothetical protein